MPRTNRYITSEQSDEFLKQRGAALEAELLGAEARLPEVEESVTAQIEQVENQAAQQVRQLQDQLDAERDRVARLTSALADVDAGLSVTSPPA